MATEGRDVGRLAGLSSLLVLYTVWSTTYLAIRVAVRPGSGFPPFVMSGTRLLAAGALILAIAVAMRRPLRVSASDAARLAASAALLWLGGNGLVTWAVQYAASGYAALMVGAMPIWTTVIEALLDRRPPTRRVVAALLVGFAGVALLTVPELRHATASSGLAVVALVLAPISWGSGAVLQNRRPVAAAPLASAGWQQILGGAGFLVVSAAFGEPSPQPGPAALAGWAYLVVFGGLAFIAFVQALRLLPTRVVMTYAYVNPVGAALLGWAILGEPITPWTVAGAALVIAGVAGVFRERYGL
jgi:drug/metabolite transporter (DMT)-like permease